MTAELKRITKSKAGKLITFKTRATQSLFVYGKSLVSLCRRCRTVAQGSSVASPELHRKPLALRHKHEQARAWPVPQALSILPHQRILDGAASN